MKTSPILYEKEGQIVQVNDKFIYEDSIYQVFKGGIALYEEKYYASSKPIKLKKKDLTNRKKKSDTYLVRYFTLEFAPESWLQKEGFTIILN